MATSLAFFRRCKSLLSTVLLAGLVGSALLSSPAWAQQPAAPPAAPVGGLGAPGAAFSGDFGPMPVRLVLSILDQFSYRVHPFYQITGDPGYDPGKAGGSSSIFLASRSTTVEENIFLKIFHNIPPFSLEGVKTLDVFFPKGLGLTFDYNAFSQVDVQAGNESAAVTPLTMDTYMYMPGFKFFAFDPTKPGLNYYIGVAVGRLEGKALYPEYYDAMFAYHYAETATFGKSGVGMQKMGLESKGDNWAFRYELMFVRAREIKLSKPYPNQTNTLFSMSGTIVRIAFFYEFN